MRPTKPQGGRPLNNIQSKGRAPLNSRRKKIHAKREERRQQHSRKSRAYLNHQGNFANAKGPGSGLLLELGRICQKLNIDTRSEAQKRQEAEEQALEEKLALEKKLEKQHDSIKHGHRISSDEDEAEDMHAPTKPQIKKNRVLMLKELNEQEDENIKELEDKLLLNKRKNKSKLPNSFVESGLDYLLELCDDRLTRQHTDYLNPDGGIADELKKALISGRSGNKNDDDNDDVIDDKKKKKQTKQEKLDLAGKSREGKRVRFAVDDDDDYMDGDAEEMDAFSDDDIMDTDEETGSEEDEDCNSKIASSTNNRKNNNDSNSDKNSNKKDSIVSDKNSNSQRMKNVVTSALSSSSSSAKEKNNDDENHDGDTKEGQWEDIYGRMRDKHGGIVESRVPYIPPAKRLAVGDSDKQAQLARLRRIIKGFVNRLSEPNLLTVGRQIEELYRKYPKNDVSSTLNIVICEAVVSESVTPDRLIMEHAMLIAMLHCNIGCEIGAQTLEDVIHQFKSMFEEVERGGGKRMENMTALLCYLCVFDVIQPKLVFDLIRKFAEEFNDKDIDVIINMLRTAGFSLRKKDPVGLKDVILFLQQKCLSDTQESNSKRKFMMEIIMAIRNNNMLKIPNYNPGLLDQARKTLRAAHRPGTVNQDLSISLADLLNAECMGKWWLVGSAWAGPSASQRNDNNDQDAPSASAQTEQFSAKILQLAEKHRMNTDLRRNIFCVLMSAEDYMDAGEKLIRMKLTKVQQRELCYVIIHCCRKEKTSNPYYGHLAKFFCGTDRDYQMTFKCALWDQFKESSHYKPREISNLAYFIVLLLTERCLSLDVFKTIQFVDMNNAIVRLLRQVFFTLFTERPTHLLVDLFEGIANSPKLSLLREGLRLFLAHFFVPQSVRDKMSPDVSGKLNSAIELAQKILTATDYM